MDNVKVVIKIVDFFMNKSNMEYLLKGNIIDNFDEVHANIFNELNKKNGSILVYEPRLDDPNHPDNRNLTHIKKQQSEYPDESDRIVAKVLRYIKGVNGNDSLEIEVLDPLYYFKLSQPVIKLNGYFVMNDNNTIHINNITRLTLADRNS